MPDSFEDAMRARVDAMLDACTKCGKCFEACPITTPAGIGDADPVEAITGALDILRTGSGPDVSRKWASSCVLSGECIKVCDYGVNPRFLLNMARISMARAKHDPVQQRKLGVDGFRLVARDVTQLSRLQLGDADLARLGQDRSASSDAEDEAPDVVFYTGCNVLKTPHIALLALDILDAIGVSYRSVGGPTHCCGVVPMRTGDLASSGRVGQNTMSAFTGSKTGKVLAWCPSCFVQFSEFAPPATQSARSARPFEIIPFMLYLRSKLDCLGPKLRAPVPMRIALHRHTGVHGVMEAAAELLTAVPGIQLVELGQPSAGLMSNYLRALPEYKRELQLKELEAAREAGVDALVTVYHADHRELCAHQRNWPFQIVNILEILGAAMGLHHEDHYKRLKLKQDVDAILADCADLVARHGLDSSTARLAVRAMLDDQPLPLVGTRGGVGCSPIASPE